MRAAAGRCARGRRPQRAACSVTPLRGGAVRQSHRSRKQGRVFPGASWTAVGGTVRMRCRRNRDSQCCRKYPSKSSTRVIRQSSGCCLCPNPLLLTCFDSMNCMHFSESFIREVSVALQVLKTHLVPCRSSHTGCREATGSCSRVRVHGGGGPSEEHLALERTHDPLLVRGRAKRARNVSWDGEHRPHIAREQRRCDFLGP